MKKNQSQEQEAKLLAEISPDKSQLLKNVLFQLQTSKLSLPSKAVIQTFILLDVKALTVKELAENSGLSYIEIENAFHTQLKKQNYLTRTEQDATYHITDLVLNAQKATRGE